MVVKKFQAGVRKLEMQLLTYITIKPVIPLSYQEDEVAKEGEGIKSPLRNVLSSALEEDSEKLNACSSILLSGDMCEIRPASNRVLTMPVGGTGCLTAGCDNTLRILLWCEGSLVCEVLVVDTSGVLHEQLVTCSTGANEVEIPLKPSGVGGVHLSIVDPALGSVFATLLLLALPEAQLLEMESLCQELLRDRLNAIAAVSGETSRSTTGGIGQTRVDGTAVDGSELLAFLPWFMGECGSITIPDANVFSQLVDLWQDVTLPVFTDYGFLLRCQPVFRDHVPEYVDVLAPSICRNSDSPLFEKSMLHPSLAAEVLEDMLTFLVKHGKMACVELLLTVLFDEHEVPWAEFRGSGDEIASKEVSEKIAMAWSRDGEVQSGASEEVLDVTEQELQSMPKQLPAAGEHSAEESLASSSCDAEKIPKEDPLGTADVHRSPIHSSLSVMGFWAVSTRLLSWSLKGFPSAAQEARYLLHLFNQSLLLNRLSVLLYFCMSLTVAYSVLADSQYAAPLTSSMPWTPGGFWQEVGTVLFLMVIFIGCNGPNLILNRLPGGWLQSREKPLWGVFLVILAVTHLGLALDLWDLGLPSSTTYVNCGAAYWMVYFLRPFSLQAHFVRYLLASAVECYSMGLFSCALGSPWLSTLLRFGSCWVISASAGLATDMVWRYMYLKRRSRRAISPTAAKMHFDN